MYTYGLKNIEVVYKPSPELPGFERDVKPQKIKDFVEADKPLRTENLGGHVNPVTGVPLIEKTVPMPDGDEKIMCFPGFPHDFQTKIDESLYLESDYKQFRQANADLAGRMERDPDLRSKFTPEQISQIEAGETPDGYTWHHHEEPGILQLVDEEVHAKTSHTGGRHLWGGGKEYR